MLAFRPPREGGLVGLADVSTEPNHLQNVMKRRSRDAGRWGQTAKTGLSELFTIKPLPPPINPKLNCC
jgi:hypothetical protein